VDLYATTYDDFLQLFNVQVSVSHTVIQAEPTPLDFIRGFQPMHFRIAVIAS
jgi:hypothetical protein